MSLSDKHIAILAEDNYQELELHFSSRVPDDLPAFCRAIIKALA
jgi:hypothetical protein